MHYRSTLSAVFALCVSAAFAKDEVKFACSASAFELPSFQAEPSVLSPDSSKRIQLRRDYTFAVWDKERQIASLDHRDLNCCIEVGWSPDSTQFFVMYSDSGGNGSFTVHWYAVSQGTVSEIGATKAVANDFSAKYSCREGGPNNIFLLGWTRDSSKVLLVTEVAGRNCGKYPDRYQGYLVDTKSQSVIQRYGAEQTDKIEKNCRRTGVLKEQDLR